MNFRALPFLVAVLFAVGCGSSPEGSGDVGSTSGASNAGDAGTTIKLADGGGSTSTVDSGAPPSTPMLIYAHTDTTLLQGDPQASPIALTVVGNFDCASSGNAMTDLAVDQSGNLYGVSETAAYPLQIQGSTVHCAQTWTLPSSSKFYGLTFAPAGVLRATEMLVAANSNGELWSIDEQGQTTQVGVFGTVPANDGHGHTYANAGKAWELSGDIVFLSNGGSPIGFATVRDCPNPPSTSGCDTVDTLVEINVTKLAAGSTQQVIKSIRGQVVKSATCTDSSTTSGYGSMFGVAAWNNTVFGFSRSGDLVQIDNNDGTACLVQSYPTYKFAGAAVSTAAPVIGPN